MAIWKHGDNAYHEYHESGDFGKAAYMLVFRNHGQEKWLAVVGSPHGGVTLLVDKKATDSMREERAGCFTGNIRLLSSTDPDFMKRACETALKTGSCEIDVAA